MRVSLRLAFILCLAISTILGVNGALRLQMEREQFRADNEHDLSLYGGALAEIVARDWKQEGEQAARQLLAARGGPQALTVRVGSRGEAGLPQPGQGPVHSYTPDAHVVVFPLRIDDPRQPVLVFMQSRGFEERYLEASRRRVVGSTLLTILVCVLILVGTGAVMVGRPMRELVALARRVSGGELEARAEVAGRDEFAELGREMNIMCARLAESRDATARETAAHLAALEQLRHADRLATVGTLAAGVAHELGTPLNVIDGRAKQIEAKDLPRERVQENARIISGQVARMSAVIRGLLEFSRMKGGPRAAVDLRGLAARTARLLDRHAEGTGVTIQVEGAEDVVVQGDATQIEQVLANLVVNGIQAMPEGGPLGVSVGRRRARHPQRGTEGQWAYLRVEDRGQGIPEEHRERLFEPFFTTKGVGEGTGLGLSVAHGIVADHGGWIDVETTVGQGSAFTAYLPLPAAPAGPQTSEAAPQEGQAPSVSSR